MLLENNDMGNFSYESKVNIQMDIQVEHNFEK